MSLPVERSAKARHEERATSTTKQRVSSTGFPVKRALSGLACSVLPELQEKVARRSLPSHHHFRKRPSLLFRESGRQQGEDRKVIGLVSLTRFTRFQA